MEDKEIDIRSEAIRDYLERAPNGLIRWGTAALCSILVLMFSLTWFIHYPTLIRADFKLTTEVAPKPVMARINGRLEKLLILNNDSVYAGQVLGFLESTADHNEILELNALLQQVTQLSEAGDYNDLNARMTKTWNHLGDVQPSYQLFCVQFSQLNFLIDRGYYNKRVQLLKSDTSELRKMNMYLQSQLILYERDVQLAQNEFEINKKLFEDNAISKLDLDKEESKMLARKIPVKNIETSVLNNNAQIRIKEKELIDLDKLLAEQKETFKQSVSSLKSEILSWMNKYALISPCSGELVYTSNFQEKDDIPANTELFRIYENKSNYIGTLNIPQDNAGKIKKGQSVLIKFHSFPFEEYGIVKGKVFSVPQLSIINNSSFFALAQLPDGLKTNQGKELSYTYGMTASAEIITEDVRLIERIFYTFRKIFD